MWNVRLTNCHHNKKGSSTPLPITKEIKIIAYGVVLCPCFPVEEGAFTSLHGNGLLNCNKNPSDEEGKIGFFDGGNMVSKKRDIPIDTMFKAVDNETKEDLSFIPYFYATNEPIEIKGLFIYPVTFYCNKSDLDRLGYNKKECQTVEGDDCTREFAIVKVEV